MLKLIQLQYYMWTSNLLPFLLSHIHTNKHVTWCVTWSHGSNEAPCFFLVQFWKQHRGWKCHLAKPCVKPLLEMWSSWQRAEVQHNFDSVCCVHGVWGWTHFRSQHLQHWSQIVVWGKNRAPCFQKVLGGNEGLVQQKLWSPTALCRQMRIPHWPCSQITVYLTFSQFLCRCREAQHTSQIPHFKHSPFNRWD